jgi:hypothetical protein
MTTIVFCYSSSRNESNSSQIGREIKKEDEIVLKNKERERGRLTFWSTFDVGPNADHDECQKSSR